MWHPCQQVSRRLTDIDRDRDAAWRFYTADWQALGQAERPVAGMESLGGQSWTVQQAVKTPPAPVGLITHRSITPRLSAHAAGISVLYKSTIL